MKIEIQTPMKKNFKLLIIAIVFITYSLAKKQDCPDETRVAVVVNLGSELCKKIPLKNYVASEENEHSVLKTNYTTDNQKIGMSLICYLEEFF